MKKIYPPPDEKPFSKPFLFKKLIITNQTYFMLVFIHAYYLLFLISLLLKKDLRSVLQELPGKLLLLLWCCHAILTGLALSGKVTENSLLHFSFYACFSVFAPLSYLLTRNKYLSRTFMYRDAAHALPLVICLAGSIALGYSSTANTWLYGLFFSLLGPGMATLYFLLCSFLLNYTTYNVFVTSNPALPQNNWLQPSTGQQDSYNKPSPTMATHLSPSVNRQYYFNETQVNKMKTVITELMNSRLPFLNQHYSLADLSEQTGIQLHQLSAFINSAYKMNYNNLINMYRIEYCKNKLLTEETWKYLTLEAIAKQSGFGHRNTFTIAFKKFNGNTPADFLKSIKTGKQYAA